MTLVPEGIIREKRSSDRKKGGTLRFSHDLGCPGHHSCPDVETPQLSQNVKVSASYGTFSSGSLENYVGGKGTHQQGAMWNKSPPALRRAFGVWVFFFSCKASGHNNYEKRLSKRPSTVAWGIFPSLVSCDKE